MIMTNFQMNFLKNLKLMVKLTAKVVMRKKVCIIIKKQKMIFDTNLKLIKDGNISALYMQNGTMHLDTHKEPYQFVVLNIKNKSNNVLLLLLIIYMRLNHQLIQLNKQI